MEALRSGTGRPSVGGVSRCARLGNAGGAPTTPSSANLFTPLAQPLPPGPGHVTASPPLALSRGSSPPRRPFFLPPSESQDLSAAPFRNPSARPRLPAPPTPPTEQLPLALSRPVSTTSNEQDGPFFPKGQAATVNGRRVRGRGEARVGILFRGGGCSGSGHFTTGGRCCTSKMAAPCRLEEL